MIKKLKQHALIYLPLINATFTNYNLKSDAQYTQIIENLKQMGDLDTFGDTSMGQEEVATEGVP